MFHTEKTPIMNIYGIVHVLPKILYSEGLHMENFKSKFVTAEAAVAAAVKDGDWVDYGFGGGYPELLDKALAARKGHLKDVKVRGGLVIRPRIEVVEADP